MFRSKISWFVWFFVVSLKKFFKFWIFVNIWFQKKIKHLPYTSMDLNRLFYQVSLVGSFPLRNIDCSISYIVLCSLETKKFVVNRKILYWCNSNASKFYNWILKYYCSIHLCITLCWNISNSYSFYHIKKKIDCQSGIWNKLSAFSMFNADGGLYCSQKFVFLIICQNWV